MGVNPFANHFRPTDIEGDGGKGQGREMEGGRGGGGRQGISFTTLLLTARGRYPSYYHSVTMMIPWYCKVDYLY